MDRMTTELTSLSAYYMPSTALRLLEVVLNISSKDSLSTDEERGLENFRDMHRFTNFIKDKARVRAHVFCI